MNHTTSNRNRFAQALIVAVLPVFLASSVRAQQQQQQQRVRYTVQEGDTCASIARTFYGDRQQYWLVHELNDLGPPPHRLVPGSVLLLPAQEVAFEGEPPEARVARVVRQVEARSPATIHWQRARRGLGLRRGWRVATQEASMASIDFRDSSRLQVRENTLLAIYGGSRDQTRSVRREAHLLNGQLRARLTEMRVSLGTDHSVAGLASGQSVFALSDDGTSRLSNHEGGDAELVDRQGQGAVTVRPGFGSKVVPGRRPTAPRPLPPSPRFLDRNAVTVVAAPSHGATLRGAFEGVPNARAYRIEVSLTEDGADVVAAVLVDGQTTSFQFVGVPPGRYFVRLATIGADLFESRPSLPRLMVVASSLLDGGDGASLGGPDSVGPGSVGPDSVGSDADEIARYASLPTLGEFFDARGRSELSFSDGVRCRLREDDAYAASLSLNGLLSPTALDCRDAEERPAEAFYVLTSAPESPPVEPPAPEIVTPSSPHLGQELSNLVVDPFHVGVRNAQRRGTTLWTSLALSDRAGTDRLSLVQTLGAEIAFWDHRIQLGASAGLGLVAPDGMSSTSVDGVHDLRLETRVRVLGGERVALLAGAMVWLPTSKDGLSGVRLSPAVDLDVRLGERYRLRTRQAALLAIHADGLRAWGSAYGIDMRVHGIVSLGSELQLSLGRFEGDFFVGAQLSTALRIGTELWSIHLGPRVGLSPDSRQALGSWMMALGARVALDAL